MESNRLPVPDNRFDRYIRRTGKDDSMERAQISQLETQLQLIDLHAALERLGRDTDLLGEIAEDFLETYEEAYEAVVRAAEAKDAPELQLTAHSLKGAVRNFGAQEAQAAAFRLEMMGRLSEFEGSVAALACLRITLEDLRPEMELLAQREMPTS
jgi:HPt (histidine-containing phosphotransfer) domain-containing protein